MKIIVATDHINLFRLLMGEFQIENAPLVNLCNFHSFRQGFEIIASDKLIFALLDELDCLYNDGYEFEIVCFGPLLQKELKQYVDFPVTNCNCNLFRERPELYEPSHEQAS